MRVLLVVDGPDFRMVVPRSQEFLWAIERMRNHTVNHKLYFGLSEATRSGELVVRVQDWRQLVSGL